MSHQCLNHPCQMKAHCKVCNLDMDCGQVHARAQQLVARIKRSSKYYYQRPNGDWFNVKLNRRYPVVSGNNNAYELRDVAFGVRLDDGSVMEIKS